MEKFERRKPTSENPAHFTWLNVEGKIVGETIAQYSSKPFPHYYLGNIGINENERGQGYGSKMLDDFEEMLLKTGRAGVLNDNLEYHNGKDSPAIEMYGRRGWTQFGDSTLYTFNLPEGISEDDLKKLVAVRNNPVAHERHRTQAMKRQEQRASDDT